MSLKSPDVCIRGAGAVGLSLALALSRQGLSVALVSAADASTAARGPDVRTYALNAGARSLLQVLKVWDALPEGGVTPVHDMQVQGDAPGAQLDFSAWTQGVDALGWIVDAAELEAALRAAVRFAPHVQTVSAPVAAPLTVLAEGKDSAGRAERGVRFQRHGYGQVAVAARLVGEQPHEGIARQWFRAPDVLALLPFDRPEAGRSWGLVWSLPEARAAEMMAAPVEAFEAALAEATGGAVGTLKLGSERAAWPLAIGHADRLCGPGWVLVGDAAHQVHPLAGQGLNLGLADVASLAGVLAGREPWRPLGDETLLRRHARARALPVQAMSQVTDGLLHLFASEAPLLRELRNRGMMLVNRLSPLKRLLTARALDA